MTTQRFPRQLVPVRPVHLETPASYLRRLCRANSIHYDWITQQIKARQRHTGDPRETGHVIHELGGPPPEWFEAAHAAASLGRINPCGPWDRQRAAHQACRWCTPNDPTPAHTYPHTRSFLCRRHRTWLGLDGSRQRHNVLTAELWNAKRRLRRMVTRGTAAAELIEIAWLLVREHHFLMPKDEWRTRLLQAQHPDFTRDVDDRLALDPATIHALATLTRPNLRQRALSGEFDAYGLTKHILHLCDTTIPYLTSQPLPAGA